MAGDTNDAQEAHRMVAVSMVASFAIVVIAQHWLLVARQWIVDRLQQK